MVDGVGDDDEDDCDDDDDNGVVILWDLPASSSVIKERQFKSMINGNDSDNSYWLMVRNALQ